MWLVICGASDLPALWAARGLKTVGLRPLEIVTGESLSYNRCLVHRLSAQGNSTTIELRDGRVIDSGAVRGVLNRLQSLPLDHLRTANAVDRQYAEQELYALFLSWLHALPGPVLNRPAPQGLSGAWRHLSEWIWLAGKAEIPALGYRFSDASETRWENLQSFSVKRTAIVVDDTVCGTFLPAPLRAGCLALAKLSDTGLLGIDFHLSANGQWRFANATPLPDLRIGGAALVHALYRTLTA